VCFHLHDFSKSIQIQVCAVNEELDDDPVQANQSTFFTKERAVDKHATGTDWLSPSSSAAAPLRRE
jgi:hypothetical protein